MSWKLERVFHCIWITLFDLRITENCKRTVMNKSCNSKEECPLYSKHVFYNIHWSHRQAKMAILCERLRLVSSLTVSRYVIRLIHFYKPNNIFNSPSSKIPPLYFLYTKKLLYQKTNLLYIVVNILHKSIEKIIEAIEIFWETPPQKL